jgi:hypothetical protein
VPRRESSPRGVDAAASHSVDRTRYRYVGTPRSGAHNDSWGSWIRARKGRCAARR